jgi:anaerobic nitric oxide reductase transcription regulator
MTSSLPDKRSFRKAVHDFQRNFIVRAVANRDGNWAAAARDLGMHRSNLHNLAVRLGLRKKK